MGGLTSIYFFVGSLAGGGSPPRVGWDAKLIAQSDTHTETPRLFLSLLKFELSWVLPSYGWKKRVGAVDGGYLFPQLVDYWESCPYGNEHFMLLLFALIVLLLLLLHLLLVLLLYLLLLFLLFLLLLLPLLLLLLFLLFLLLLLLLLLLSLLYLLLLLLLS